MFYAAPTCITDWMGDGKCNQDNNNFNCSYDDGDCCAHSCKFNCEEIDEEGNDITNVTFYIMVEEESAETGEITITYKEKRRSLRPCKFVCGSFDYNCTQTIGRCLDCNADHATCRPQDECFEKLAGG